MRRAFGLALLLAGACWWLALLRSGGRDLRLLPGRGEMAPALAEAAPQTGYTAEESNNIAIYRRVSPSVVNITSQIMGFSFFMGPEPESGQGSGFFIDRDGDILTNYHVIQDAQKLTVTWTPERNQSHHFTARVVGQAPTLDLAVIHVSGGPFPPATLGDSTHLEVGQTVLAIGNPYGLPGTMTKGILSSIRTVQESGDTVDIENALQTDAPINPGNSGGPLLNSQGEVIGIDTMIFSQTGSNVGIGFAIPINAAKAVLDPLLKTGKLPAVELGIGQQITVNGDVADQLGLPIDHGILVLEVAPGGMAARAGIHGGTQPGFVGRTPVRFGGDILIAFNGEPLDDYSQLANLLLLRKPGTPATLTLVRGGKTMDVKLPLP